MQRNTYGQPIGPSIENWTPRSLPPRTPLIGRTCRIEPVDAERHSDDLFAAYHAAADDRDWTYLPSERPATKADFAAYVASMAASSDPMHYTIIDLGIGKAVGTAAHMRIDPANGTIEVGFIRWSPLMQRRVAGTEAIYLLMRRALMNSATAAMNGNATALMNGREGLPFDIASSSKASSATLPSSRTAAGTLLGSP